MMDSPLGPVCLCVCKIFDLQEHMGGTWTANYQILGLTSCCKEALSGDSNLIPLSVTSGFLEIGIGSTFRFLVLEM